MPGQRDAVFGGGREIAQNEMIRILEPKRQGADRLSINGMR